MFIHIKVRAPKRFTKCELGLCSPIAMLDGSRFSCHATIIVHDMKLMSIAKK